MAPFFYGIKRDGPRNKNVDSLIETVSKCEGDVLLKSVDGREVFNLKSVMSRYIAIGRLCDDHGDEYEVFCMNREDEHFLLQFFYNLKQESLAS